MIVTGGRTVSAQNTAGDRVTTNNLQSETAAAEAAVAAYDDRAKMGLEAYCML